jgi:hypothetical protein
MSDVDADVAFGRSIVRTLADFSSSSPLGVPLVREQYRSLGKLHAELILHGMALVQKKDEGPEGGHMLIYAKGNVIVRIKTRGGGKFLGGNPHLSVCLLSGKTLSTGAVDVDYKQEVGKFHVGGGLVNKRPLYRGQDVKAKYLVEQWADATHLTFPGLDFDDSAIVNIEAPP